MNLRNRTLLHLGLVFFAVFIVIALVSFTVTMSGLDRIEYTDMHKASNQVNSAISGEEASLLSTTQDWGWWDEMLQFTVDHDARFIERNANPDNLATVKVHLIVIADSDGRILYSRLLSPDYRENTTVPDDLMQALAATPGLIPYTGNDQGRSGLLIVPEGPMIVAATPILHSDKSGPSGATILMGRYVMYGPIQKIEEVSGYPVGLFWNGTAGAGAGRFGALQTRFAGDDSFIVIPDNESMTTGYSRSRDLAGRDLIIAASSPRDVYHAGLANIYTYLLLLALWAIMSAVVVTIVMDLSVLQRIEMLTERVRTLPGESDEIPAAVLTGSDELTALEQTIIESRAGLRLSERQLRAFIDALPNAAAMYTRDGTILVGNAAFAAYLQTDAAKLPGTRIYDYPPRDDLQRYIRQGEDVLVKKVAVQHEVESGGRTFLISHYPVLDPGGEVVQIGLLTFDISERKRLENALQKVTKKIALLNTVIFNDIQNKIFVQRGYQEILRKQTPDPAIGAFLDKQESAVREIQTSLDFARQYNDMGMNPPLWQNVRDVMVFAISHLELGNLRREFRLNGLEIYADPLLERVFFNLVENVLRHATGATVIRADYSITKDGALIVVSDDGPGIPAADKEKIFEKGTGTGGAVGLFLSREILSITGITLHETGEPGSGARFELLVPEGSYRAR